MNRLTKTQLEDVKEEDEQQEVQINQTEPDQEKEDKENEPINQQQQLDEQTEKQNQQEIEYLKNKALKEGENAIKRAQNLVKQIERQKQKQGIGEEDDENQKKYQELIQLKRTHQEKYLMKVKEFELTEKMDMDKIQNAIIENFNQNLQKEQQKLEDEVNEKERIRLLQLQQNPRLFPERLPQIKNIKKHFENKTPNIFNSLKPQQIREYYEKMKKQQKKYEVQEYMDEKAYEKLEELYYRTYMEWSYRQPYVEDQRLLVRENLVENFELLSILNNQPSSLDNPLIYHRVPFTDKEREYVDNWMKKKEQIKTNKYAFLEEDLDIQTDILKQVEKYLESNVFNAEDTGQDNLDENIDDENLKNMKRIDEISYNEKTLLDFDDNLNYKNN